MGLLRGVVQKALERYVPPRGISERVGELVANPKERAALTAQERGEPVGKVIEDFITGKAPLLGIPIGAFALSQLDGADQEPAYA